MMSPGSKQETNVLRIKIESANNFASKFARKQSNEIKVSVLWPSCWPAEKVFVISFGYVTLKDVAAAIVWT